MGERDGIKGQRAGASPHRTPAGGLASPAALAQQDGAEEQKTPSSLPAHRRQGSAHSSPPDTLGEPGAPHTGRQQAWAVAPGGSPQHREEHSTRSGPGMGGAQAHQGRVLHVVPQQPRVVEGVLGLLQHSVHRALLHLVLDGLEELVQRLTSAVLRQCGWSALGDHAPLEVPPGQVGSSTPCPPQSPPACRRAPTLRYWYRQIDIQLDSILSTTVSDLGVVQTGLVTQGPPWCPTARLALQAPGPASTRRPGPSLQGAAARPLRAGGGTSLRPRGRF